ncbi:PREDICTED: uncharacterized protein C45G9.7-like [Rhagoletis zephyria]|uniref:uncharacterized protein C45G9.7-like n=1 Tax=Rhagoletis zephyria TaxID=28612 RepID=UPI000811440E|nr:PREDICTED: uncharacterized protein C45G9.7-like [Rhagoletis zephyria]
MSASFEHTAGDAIACLSIPIKLYKEQVFDGEGREVLRCGFKIGGGIDQDFRQSPHNFTDNGIYVTATDANGPAARAGLRFGDKILQCNDIDFTMMTHKKAVEFIRKAPVLELLIARRGGVGAPVLPYS